MTILGLKSQLLTHFATNDCFDPSKHAVEINEEMAVFGREMLGIALGQLEEIGLVKKLTATANPVWVLALPLDLVPQPVYIERDLGEAIAEVVDHYNEMEDIDIECNPSKIDQHDIWRVLSILHDLEEELFGEDDGGPKGNKDGPDLSQYNPGVN